MGERDGKGKLSAEGGDNLKSRKKRVSLLVGQCEGEIPPGFCARSLCFG